MGNEGGGGGRAAGRLSTRVQEGWMVYAESFWMGLIVDTGDAQPVRAYLAEAVLSESD